MAHAKLSPSSASRWLVCTPSAAAEYGLNSSSVYAEEGTLAHAIGELMIGYKAGKILTKKYKAELKKLQENELYSADMLDNCEQYSAFVMAEYNRALAITKDAKLFTESRIDMTDYIPEGFGTLDNNIVCEDWAHIIDLKYGKGVPVSAVRNKQLMVYAVGAVSLLLGLYAIKKVIITIYQPRIDNTSTWEISVEELMKWAEDELKPKAAMAFNGEGEYVAGDHCRFCKIKATCKTNADLNLDTFFMSLPAGIDSVERQDEQLAVQTREPNILQPRNISFILQRKAAFENWIQAVHDHALEQATLHGVQYPGMKLVEGRSNRQVTDENKVVEVLTGKGVKEDELYKRKFIGITDLTKILGSVDFNKYVGPYLVKPAGKPVLVVEADKRPAYSSAEKAAEVFKDIL